MKIMIKNNIFRPKQKIVCLSITGKKLVGSVSQIFFLMNMTILSGLCNILVHDICTKFIVFLLFVKYMKINTFYEPKKSFVMIWKLLFVFLMIVLGNDGFIS